MIKVIGLTGQMGSGKSLAASILKEMGAAVIDADELARQVVAVGQPALSEICAAFGCQYLLPEGELDRQALGALVFADDKARYRLNAITHPRIQEKAQGLIEQYSVKGRELIVLDAALLIGSDFADMLDEIWLITAPAEQIYTRLAWRDSLSREEITARLKTQLPPEAQAAKADLVIVNDSDEQNLREKLIRALTSE